MMIGSSAMQSIVGCTTLMKIINGTQSILNYPNVTDTYQNHVPQSVGRQLMRLQKQPLSEWQYTTTDGQVRYLMAPDLEHAAWAAAELSGGTQFLKDVKRCDEW